MPLHLPYASSNWSDYERIDGEIEFNGMYYNYVKRKVQHDTLFLLCLPNKTKAKLYTARNNYAQEINPVPASNKSNHLLFKKNILPEYNPPVTLVSFTALQLFTRQQQHWRATDLINSFIEAPYHPPRVIG